MQEKILLTPVDSLVDFVKEKGSVSISQLEQKLKIPEEVIQKWVIVLEEFKVLKVSYKGFEGYVSFNLESKKKDNSSIDVDNLKQIFIEKSQKKGLSYDEMRGVWPSFIKKFEGDIRALFVDKANNLKIDPIKIDPAWNKYKKDLEVL